MVLCDCFIFQIAKSSLIPSGKENEPLNLKPNRSSLSDRNTPNLRASNIPPEGASKSLSAPPGGSSKSSPVLNQSKLPFPASNHGNQPRLPGPGPPSKTLPSGGTTNPSLRGAQGRGHFYQNRPPGGTSRGRGNFWNMSGGQEEESDEPSWSGGAFNRNRNVWYPDNNTGI